MITYPISFFGAEYGPPKNGLVLYLDASSLSCYSGTGDVQDLSPRGYTGQVVNVGYTANRFEFSYTGPSYIAFRNQSPSFGYTSTWSYVTWFKVLGSTATYLYDCSATGTIDQGSNIYNWDPQKIRPWNGSYHGMPGVTAATGSWHCVAFCKGPSGLSGNYKSYKDGVLQDTVTADFSFNSGANFTINTTSWPADWHLYRLMVYNRALTDDEVSDLYNLLSQPT